MKTRRQRQIEVEAPFTLPPEQQARVFSFMDVRSLVGGAAVVCKRWRAIVATDAVAWTTAMSELDPCAVLGPAGVKAAAQQLHRNGGWLALAHRLSDRSCRTCTGCSATCALWFDTARLRRVCVSAKQRAGMGNINVVMLLNDFMYDKQPWRIVDNDVDLLDALREVPLGGCIRVNGHLYLDGADAMLCVQRCRLVGPQCAAGQQPQASLTCDIGSIYLGAAIVNNLRLTTGSWDMYDDMDFVAEHAFPCIEPGECVLLNGCCIRAYMVSAITAGLCCHSTIICCCAMPSMSLLLVAAACCAVHYAMMSAFKRHNSCCTSSMTDAQGTATLVDGARVAAENCVFTSNDMCLGVVMVQNRPAAISMIGCDLQHNMWGAFLGRNLSAESERAVRAVNAFRWNSEEEITRMYEYDEQTVQPWRRSWATAATVATAASGTAATAAASTTAANAANATATAAGSSASATTS